MKRRKAEADEKAHEAEFRAQRPVLIISLMAARKVLANFA